MTALVTALGCAWLAAALLELRLTAPPRELIRTNVSGRPVPAVIGGPLGIAALAGVSGLLIADAAGWDGADTGRLGAAVALLIVALLVAGSWDDRRGDEASRGFSGHLAAARRGRLTGGIVKLVAGGAAGLAAGWVLVVGGAIDWVAVIETALLVALTANLINLTDRAPGRAAKATFLIGLPLAAVGEPAWTVAAAPVLGALAGVVRADLGERAMLGDAGANPLGAVCGLGLAVSLSATGRVVALLALLALNLASERWSFSRVIERTGWLRAVDRLGRK